MSKVDEKQLRAMISLLDDDDDRVIESLENHLLEIGKEAIPFLEEKWSHSLDALLQSRIENIVHKIQFESVKSDLAHWKNHLQHDLLAGVVTIARYQYPDLDEQHIFQFFNQAKRRVWEDLNEFDTPLEQIRNINQVLFNEYGFSGNTANFHAPQNSFINTVIESKRGNPILLSVIYTILAQDLDIPVYGVNLPEHFILCYQHIIHDKDTQYTFPDANIIFYINAFSKGSVFGKEEIDHYLKKLNLQPELSFYTPCQNIDIVSRIIRNLHYSFAKSGYADKAKEVEALLEIMKI
jgi:regulator of sirC expression with transglutaminase-like and TPR domain